MRCDRLSPNSPIGVKEGGSESIIDVDFQSVLIMCCFGGWKAVRTAVHMLYVDHGLQAVASTTSLLSPAGPDGGFNG